MIREFFYLQKSDRKVILTLLAVIVVALGVIFLTGEEENQTNALVPADTLKKASRYDTARHFRERTKTVYVRTKVIYRDTAYRRAAPRRNATVSDSASSVFQMKIKKGEYVVLNTADTTILKSVPGIGPYYARKIVQYGQRLGGYVSVDQLDEIEDFPLDAKDYLVIRDAAPVKLNVNQLSLYELRRHPYINFYQAKAITDYRRLHGPIKSLNDLSLSKVFPPEDIARLLPYVAY